MAETGEIVAGAGVLGGALAAFLAALGWRNKSGTQPENGDYKMLSMEITELKRRQGETDRRMDDVFDLLTDAHKALTECQTNTREALTRLDERRHER